MGPKKGGSQQDVNDTGSTNSLSDCNMIESPSEIVLSAPERKYLLYIQRGDVASVRRHLEEFKDKPQELDVNCTDPLGRSGIAVAIENENLDLLEALLDFKVKPKDALLHAIAEEYVEGVEVLLAWEEKSHKKGEPYSWEGITRETANFTKDITPLILAAHHNHYEILKLLLDRGASLPMPHDIRCGCDDCLISTEDDSLRHSLSRINAYKALAAPSLIALSSKDPIRTAFELSGELRRLQGMEHEFKAEYISLRKGMMTFVAELLDQTRTRIELSTMLNYDPDSDGIDDGDGLARLKEAIKYRQKQFVAHPNVQQYLGAIWYDGLPGFRRLPFAGQCIEVGKLACMFPILSMCYIINPGSEKGKFMKKPFVKFISHCASYMFFLMLLALASQRIEYLLIEWFGTQWLRSLLEDWKMRERGILPGLVEVFIVMYIFSLVWAEIKSLWSDGLMEYIKDLWNIIDFITNSFFMAWICLRATAFIIVQRDLWYGLWPYYPREQWDSFDPMLLSEGFFGAAMIFSFLKLVHIFSVNPHLGPLQISLGRMIFDIMKFFFLYTLVLFAFGCGLNQLMWYYAELEMNKCYSLPGGLPNYKLEEQACFIWRRFANLFETSQSLFWASFGLVELDAFELTGVGSFTRFWAMLMFGSYSMINIIVLLNLLIAMMSNSYNLISERSDTEWKFARTTLWLSYFEDGATVPPPFNVIPTPKGIMRAMGISGKKVRGSMKEKSKKRSENRHQNVMRLLVRRYITEQQRKADEKGVTEDDINEVKQDISTFRYELIDILKNNGMNTSMVNAEDSTVVGKKGRAMERRLMKGFNIGMVEGLMTEILTSEKKPKNIFGKLAKAMGKKKKEDWNAKVSRASLKRDQIGNSQISLRRSRTSIRKRIQYENEKLLKTMNPDSIAEYNPNLEEHTPSTRVAYAKFKVATIKKEKERLKNTEAQQKAASANQTLDAEKKQDAAGKPFHSRTPTPTPPKPSGDASPKPPSGPAPKPPGSTGPPKPPESTGPPKPPGSTSPPKPPGSTSPPKAPGSTGSPKPPSGSAPKPPGTSKVEPKSPPAAAPSAPKSSPPSAPRPGKVAVPSAFQQQGGSVDAKSPPPRIKPPPGKVSQTPPSQPLPSSPPPPTVSITSATPVPPNQPPSQPPPSSSPGKPKAASPSPEPKINTGKHTQDFGGKSQVTGQLRTGWL